MKTSRVLSAVMLFVALSFGLVSCGPSEPTTSNKIKQVVLSSVHSVCK